MNIEKNNSCHLSIKHRIYKERRGEERKGGSEGGRKIAHFVFEISHILLFSVQIPGILGTPEI